MAKNSTVNGMFAIGLAAVLLGVFWVSNEFKQLPQPAGWSSKLDTTATVFEERQIVPVFTLTDHHGEPFTLDSLRGHWTFLFFGYTFCPDVCPTALSTLARTSELLEKNSSLPQPRTVFVSVDPDRDGESEYLARYVSHFRSDFLGVTGADEAILLLTKPLGIFYRRNTIENNKDNYFVDHSASILLIDPEAQVAAVTSPPHVAVAIADDYVKIVNTHERN